jgi:hypothetical protein
MADPWQCPACKTWIRGDVAEHRCPDGGTPAVPPRRPDDDPGPISMTGLAWPQTWVPTTSTITGVGVSIPG